MEFTLADWTVDTDRCLLSRGDTELRLEESVMRLLEFLAENPRQILSGRRIVEGAWEGRRLAPGTLAAAISALRGALGDSERRPRLIETLPLRGYRLLAQPVEVTKSVPPMFDRTMPPRRRRPPLAQRWPIVFALAVAALTWLRMAPLGV